MKYRWTQDQVINDWRLAKLIASVTAFGSPLPNSVARRVVQASDGPGVTSAPQPHAGAVAAQSDDNQSECAP